MSYTKLKPILTNWTEPDQDGKCIALLRQTYKHKELDLFYRQFEVVEYDWENEQLLQQYFISENDTYEQYKIAFQVFSAFGGTESE